MAAKVARASTPILEPLPGPGPGHSLDDKDKDLLKALEPPAPPLALTDRMAEAFTQSETRALRSPDAAWPHGLRRLDPQAQAMPEYLTEASAARQSAKQSPRDRRQPSRLFSILIRGEHMSCPIIRTTIRRRIWAKK